MGGCRVAVHSGWSLEKSNIDFYRGCPFKHRNGRSSPSPTDQNSTANSVACQIARLASSSTATSAPPINVYAMPRRLEAGRPGRGSGSCPAHTTTVSTSSTRSSSPTAQVQPGVVDFQVLGNRPACARHAFAAAAAAPSRWSWPGHRRAWSALRCSSQTSRGLTVAFSGSFRPPRRVGVGRMSMPHWSCGRRPVRRRRGRRCG
jgi:hypothetical protein